MSDISEENQRLKAQCDRLGLTWKEKIHIGSIYACLAIFTVIMMIIATEIGVKYIVLAGLGIVSYVLGLRHAVDADHIAAIDNTTRKLIQQGKRPVTVGMWFSLGHSVIVIALTVALIFATRAVTNAVPAFESGGAIIGTSISGLFLVIIGLVNLMIVMSVYKAFKAAKSGKLTNTELDDFLNKNNFLSKTMGKLFKIINTPWQIFPIGILFGLGFDTATQVALIAISVGVSGSVPLYATLALPLLFTAGMVTVDTSDGVSMRCAYGWAFLKPIRKIFYNLTITIISVLVAFVIGGIELIQVWATEIGATTGVLGWFANLDFEDIGYFIIASFLIAWGIAMAFYRWKGYEKVGFAKNNPPAIAATAETKKA